MGPSAVDEEEDAIHHVQHPLDLATEIGVARSIDDVHTDRVVFEGSQIVMAVFLARIVMPRSRSRSFESITRSATCWFSRKTLRLSQEPVDQRCLAVVDVRDDGQVAKVRAFDHLYPPRRRSRRIRNDLGQSLAEVVAMSPFHPTIMRFRVPACQILTRRVGAGCRPSPTHRCAQPPAMVGRSPSVASIVCSSPSRTTVTSTTSPTSVSDSR